MAQQNITGIVLAGGKSSRMGTDKSLLVWKGKTLIEHAIDKLKPLCSKVVISSSNPVYSFTGCETWPDEPAIQAPIAGIYTCLKQTETGLNIILSCDMPLISEALLRHLLVNSIEKDVLVPVHTNGMIEPLCGIYKRIISPAMEFAIANNNLSLNKFIQSYPSPLLLIDKNLPFYTENLFLNINHPSDFEKLISLS